MLTASVLSLAVLGQYQLVAPGPKAITSTAAILPFLLFAVHWIIPALSRKPSAAATSSRWRLQLPGWLALLIPG